MKEHLPGPETNSDSDNQMGLPESEVAESVPARSKRSGATGRLRRAANHLAVGLAAVTALGGPTTAFGGESRSGSRAGTSASAEESEKERKAREAREKEAEEREEAERKERREERERRQKEEKEAAKKERERREKDAREKLDEVKHQKEMEKLKEPTKAERIAADKEKAAEAKEILKNVIAQARYVRVSAPGGDTYTENFLKGIVTEAGGTYVEPATKGEGRVLLLTARVKRRNGADVTLTATWEGKGEMPILMGMGGEHYGKNYAMWDHSRPLAELESMALAEAYDNLR
jgi:hypothetical protein